MLEVPRRRFDDPDQTDLVLAGFSNLEDVYREVRQAQQALIAETLAVTNRK
jgi:hypothetical protein